MEIVAGRHDLPLSKFEEERLIGRRVGARVEA